MIKLPDTCTITHSTAMVHIYFTSQKGIQLIAILTGVNLVQNHCIKENVNWNFTLANLTKQEIISLLKELPFEIKETNLDTDDYWLSFRATEERLALLFEKLDKK